MGNFRCGAKQGIAGSSRLPMAALFYGAGLLVGLLAEPSFAGTNAFTSVGPYGGTVNKVVYHPTNPSIVYAATGAGFYRSTNGGVSWQVVNDRILNAPRDIAVHAAKPDRVYVMAPSNGVLSSEDAGATLTVLSTYPDISGFGTDVEYSADGSMLYASSGLRIYRSTDDGNSWLQGGLAPITDTALTNLAVDPSNANVLYVIAGTGEGFQSADAGVTWQPWPVPTVGINQLAIASTQPLRIWAATSTGTWFTDDRGSHWTNSLPGVPSQIVAIDPTDPHVVYSGTLDGLQRSIDNGAHWSNIQGSAAVGFHYSIAIDPANSNHLLLSGVAGIAGSNDGGATWTSRNEGIDALNTSELISSPVADRIYINTSYDGAYAISAADHSATALNNGQLRQLSGSITVFGRGLFVYPGAPDRLLMGVSGRTPGIARSVNAGDSWALLSHPGFFSGVLGIVAGSADALTLLAATSTDLLYTVNGGNNWQDLNPLDAKDLGPIVSAPSNPQTIYLAGRLPGATSDSIMRSPNAGSSWTAHQFPKADVLSMLVDPRTEQTIYAGSGQMLFKSTNAGETWTGLTVFADTDTPFYALAIDPQNPDIVYAGGPSRVARSVDAGITWQELTKNVTPYWDVRALAVDAQRPHSLYVGLSGRGVRELNIEPDLELSATVPVGPIAYGTAATYSYRMRNIGPYDATRVRTTVQLPADTTNVTVTSPGATCSVSGALATCSTSILRVAASADITISATQPNSGSFSVVAAVQGDQPDAATANNSVTSAIQVAEVTDLSVALTGPAQVTRGDTITYSLAISNAGPNDATAAAISFQLATGLSVATVTPSVGTCATTGNNVTCQLPTLARNTSATITIVSAVSSAAGSFSSTATVDASGADLQASNDTVIRATSVNEPAPPPSKGGGGGSSSLLMLAALLLLSCVRALPLRIAACRMSPCAPAITPRSPAPAAASPARPARSRTNRRTVVPAAGRVR